MLNTGSKNTKFSPPTKGNQLGQVQLNIGNWNISTTLPWNKLSYPLPKDNVATLK